MKYRFINEHRHEFRVATMCRVLQVARAGFYAWLHKPISDRDIEDQRLLGLIRDSYTASSGVYGALRVFDYIEVFYNRNRRHSHLGGVSPEAFERASA